MARTFKTVSALHAHLKDSIADSIQEELTALCIKVVQDYIQRNVYDQYEPDPDSYDRTFELLNSVTVGNISMGTKYAKFEIYMDTDKIKAHVRTSRPVNSDGDTYGGWNAHADVYDADMSDYIPMWIEKGTKGKSLWKREPANYMRDSFLDLSEGDLADALEDALRQKGWKIINV